jgi:hypothetical protein
MIRTVKWSFRLRNNPAERVDLELDASRRLK